MTVPARSADRRRCRSSTVGAAAGDSEEAARPGRGREQRLDTCPRAARRRRRRRSRKAARSSGVGDRQGGVEDARVRFMAAWRSSTRAGLGRAPRVQCEIRGAESATRSREILRGPVGRPPAPISLREEPGPGVGPVPLGGRAGRSQGRGGLLDGQAGEVAELDELGLAGSSGREPVQGLVEGEQVLGGRRRRRSGLVQVDAGAGRRRAWRPACGGRCRRGCGAWPRPPRRRSGRGRPSPGRPRRRPAGGRPRGPGRWPGGSGRASPAPAAGRRACGARRRPAAGAARPPGGRPARWPRGCGSRRSSPAARPEVHGPGGGGS